MKLRSKVIIGLGVLVSAALTAGRKQVESVSSTAPTVPPPGDTRQRILNIARGEIGFQDATKYGGLDTNWCGNFTLWVLHQVGLASDVSPHWRWCVDLTPTTDPQPGDIAYFGPPNNHQAIVVQVDDSTVTTIDGNQEFRQRPTPGLVAEKTRARSKVSAFYTIQPLIDAAQSAV